MVLNAPCSWVMAFSCPWVVVAGEGMVFRTTGAALLIGLVGPRRLRARAVRPPPPQLYPPPHAYPPPQAYPAPRGYPPPTGPAPAGRRRTTRTTPSYEPPTVTVGRCLRQRSGRSPTSRRHRPARAGAPRSGPGRARLGGALPPAGSDPYRDAALPPGSSRSRAIPRKRLSRHSTAYPQAYAAARRAWRL